MTNKTNRRYCGGEKMSIPKEGYKEIENVTGVYIKENKLVITGIPPYTEDDEEAYKLHNCDKMGCGSVSHVLLRAEIYKKNDGYSENQ